MAKIYGLFGSMTGKLADVVMSVRNGEQIARKYQPVVFNPNTPAQIAVRAKLKELSQLSAIMAPVIAMRREGSVSARNLFTKKNFPAVNFENDTATVDLLSIKLTKGIVALPEIILSREETTLTARLTGSPSLDVNRVVYACFVRDLYNNLRYMGSRVVSDAGTNNTYDTTFTGISTSLSAVVYAYAVRENSEAAKVIFGDTHVDSAEMVAKLIASSTLTESDVTLTETRANISNPPQANTAALPEETTSRRAAKSITAGKQYTLNTDNLS